MTESDKITNPQENWEINAEVYTLISLSRYDTIISSLENDMHL